MDEIWQSCCDVANFTCLFSDHPRPAAHMMRPDEFHGSHAVRPPTRRGIYAPARACAGDLCPRGSLRRAVRAYRRPQIWVIFFLVVVI